MKGCYIVSIAVVVFLILILLNFNFSEGLTPKPTPYIKYVPTSLTIKTGTTNLYNIKTTLSDGSSIVANKIRESIFNCFNLNVASVGATTSDITLSKQLDDVLRYMDNLPETYKDKYMFTTGTLSTELFNHPNKTARHYSPLKNGLYVYQIDMLAPPGTGTSPDNFFASNIKPPYNNLYYTNKRSCSALFWYMTSPEFMTAVKKHMPTTLGKEFYERDSYHFDPHVFNGNTNSKTVKDSYALIRI